LIERYRPKTTSNDIDHDVNLGNLFVAITFQFFSGAIWDLTSLVLYRLIPNFLYEPLKVCTNLPKVIKRGADEDSRARLHYNILRTHQLLAIYTASLEAGEPTSGGMCQLA
jgi:hypothetical protein